LSFFYAHRRALLLLLRLGQAFTGRRFFGQYSHNPGDLASQPPAFVVIFHLTGRYLRPRIVQLGLKFSDGHRKFFDRFAP
jgi:hypothetical protein